MFTFISTMLFHKFHFPLFLCFYSLLISVILVEVLVPSISLEAAYTYFLKNRLTTKTNNSLLDKFTHHKNHPFQVYNSMTIKELCNYHNNLSLAHFYHLIRNPVPVSSHIPSFRGPGPCQPLVYVLSFKICLFLTFSNK